MSAWSRWFARHNANAQTQALRPEALPDGTLLGELRIERALARGASAMLYLATDKSRFFASG